MNLRYEPCIALRFYYDDEYFISGTGKQIVVKYCKINDNYQFNKISRDIEWENGIIAKLKESGLKEQDGFYSLPGIELIDNQEVLYFLINWLNDHRTEFEATNIFV